MRKKAAVVPCVLLNGPCEDLLADTHSLWAPVKGDRWGRTKLTSFRGRALHESIGRQALN